MTTERDIESKIYGCILGAALGDAIGARFEFKPVDEIVEKTGRRWIEALHPFAGQASPHGVWRDRVPVGTGTDDTRYSWIFIELATRLGHLPTAGELAAHFLRIYERPEEFFPGYPEVARGQFEMLEGVSRGCLGQTSPLYPGIPPELLCQRSVGLNYPTMAGLITLNAAGLLFPGRPEEAYKSVYLTDFYDVAYAREATALFAAAVSLAVGGEMDVKELIEQVLAMDPLQLGGYFGGPFVKEKLPPLLDSVAALSTDQELADFLSRELCHFDAFDPFKAVAIAFAAVRAAAKDPLRAILIAVNHYWIDEGGAPTLYQDVDCYAAITGALAGAIYGAEAFPADLLNQVVASNREVYGFDLEQSVARFIDAFLRDSE